MAAQCLYLSFDFSLQFSDALLVVLSDDQPFCLESLSQCFELRLSTCGRICSLAGPSAWAENRAGEYRDLNEKKQCLWHETHQFFVGIAAGAIRDFTRSVTIIVSDLSVLGPLSKSSNRDA